MKWVALVSIITVLAFVASCTAGKKQGKKSLKTDAEKYSYALGDDIGKNLKTIPIELDIESVLQGLRDKL